MAFFNIKDKERIADMYESGMNQTEIAKKFHIRQQRISAFMQANNIKARTVAEQKTVSKNEKQIGMA